MIKFKKYNNEPYIKRYLPSTEQQYDLADEEHREFLMKISGLTIEELIQKDADWKNDFEDEVLFPIIVGDDDQESMLADDIQLIMTTWDSVPDNQ